MPALRGDEATDRGQLVPRHPQVRSLAIEHHVEEEVLLRAEEADQVILLPERDHHVFDRVLEAERGHHAQLGAHEVGGAAPASSRFTIGLPPAVPRLKPLVASMRAMPSAPSIVIASASAARTSGLRVSTGVAGSWCVPPPSRAGAPGPLPSGNRAASITMCCRDSLIVRSRGVRL